MQERICPVCGKENFIEAKFCVFCGAKFTDDWQALQSMRDPALQKEISRLSGLALNAKKQGDLDRAVLYLSQAAEQDASLCESLFFLSVLWAYDKDPKEFQKERFFELIARVMQMLWQQDMRVVDEKIGEYANTLLEAGKEILARAPKLDGSRRKWGVIAYKQHLKKCIGLFEAVFLFLTEESLQQLPEYRQIKNEAAFQIAQLCEKIYAPNGYYTFSAKGKSKEQPFPPSPEDLGYQVLFRKQAQYLALWAPQRVREARKALLMERLEGQKEEISKKRRRNSGYLVVSGVICALLFLLMVIGVGEFSLVLFCMMASPVLLIALGFEAALLSSYRESWRLKRQLAAIDQEQ